MVEVANGFKIGVVKYIGETEFQPGEWIGVALDRPSGESVMLCHAPSQLPPTPSRQAQWNGEGSEIFQVQRQTRFVCTA